jgi:hypothetical protein
MNSQKAPDAKRAKAEDFLRNHHFWNVYGFGNAEWG